MLPKVILLFDQGVGGGRGGGKIAIFCIRSYSYVSYLNESLN